LPLGINIGTVQIGQQDIELNTFFAETVVPPSCKLWIRVSNNHTVIVIDDIISIEISPFHDTGASAQSKLRLWHLAVVLIQTFPIEEIESSYTLSDLKCPVLTDRNRHIIFQQRGYSIGVVRNIER